jgi:hypothetical protein
MKVRFHLHDLDLTQERGASKQEMISTINDGEQFPVKFGPTCFSHNSIFNSMWRGVYYKANQVEAYAVQDRSWALPFWRIFLLDKKEDTPCNSAMILYIMLPIFCYAKRALKWRA